MKAWKPSISVVYPMFNEEENIEHAVRFAEAALAYMTSDYEILIVNDASTDRSAELAEALARENPCVKVFHHERNLKLGGALRTGFSKATKELVFYCDSDLPVDLTELNRAVRIMEFTRSDIISAFRFDRTAEGPLRTVYSVVYNLLIRFLFPLRVKDINFSFKLFKREVLDKVALEAEGSFIDAELLIKGKLHGFNRGVLQAFQDGIVTSASLLVTGSAFEEAVTLARQNPELDVGLHLALVEERAVLGHEALPTLVDETGRFPRTSGEFFRRAVLGRISWDEVEREVAAQIARFQKTGLRLSHLNR